MEDGPRGRLPEPAEVVRAKIRLPRTARTCARLMNELWGPTTGQEVMLVGIDY
jgi:hypothetical protein